MTDPDPVKVEQPLCDLAYARIIALRESLLISVPLNDQNELCATPTDLKRAGLLPWSGRFFGIVCVESPIIRL